MAFNFPGLQVGGVDFKSKVSFHFLDSSQFDTDNTSYQPVFDFIFPGTDLITPIDFKSILWNNSSVVGQARIRDTTNSQTICESAQFSNTTQAITSFGAISNLPTGEAIFQLQIKKISGNALQDTHLKSLIVYY